MEKYAKVKNFWWGIRSRAQAKMCFCSHWMSKAAVHSQNSAGCRHSQTARTRQQYDLPILCNSGWTWPLTSGVRSMLTSTRLSARLSPACYPTAMAFLPSYALGTWQCGVWLRVKHWALPYSRAPASSNSIIVVVGARLQLTVEGPSERSILKFPWTFQTLLILSVPMQYFLPYEIFYSCLWMVFFELQSSNQNSDMVTTFCLDNPFLMSLSI